MSAVRQASACFRLLVRVQPRAARDRITGLHDEMIKVQVHAPANDGAANAALITLLATTLALPRRAVRIVRGATTRTKLVEIEGDVESCWRHLTDALRGSVDKVTTPD
jgi:uncharacterized protein (TIGR00251 family)